MKPEPDLLDRLLSGEIHSLLLTADDQQVPDASIHGAILPGSFNPLHVGHIALARVAQELTHEPVTFELAVRNVDKATLRKSEIERRTQQFAGRFPIVVTQAPTFWEKADLFPGCIFVIGVDTALRLVHPRYYDNSAAAMLAALEHIRQQGCRFLVAGRQIAGRFQWLTDVGVPTSLAPMFEGIPEALFRRDISSTEIRNSKSTTLDRENRVKREPRR